MLSLVGVPNGAPGGVGQKRDTAGDGEREVTAWRELARRRGTPLSDLLTRQLALVSPVFCAHMLLQGPAREPFNGRFLYGDFHLEVDKILTHERRFAIQAPRGTGKSAICAKAYPIWQIIRNVYDDGLLVASTQNNAVRLLSEVRQEVESNPALSFLVPRNRSRDWSQTMLRFANGHVLRVGSMGSNLRGLHPGYIIGDDVLSDKAKSSESYRRQVVDFWFSVLEPMPIPGGVLGLVGTPMNQSDLIYRTLRDTPGYRHASFPILNARGESLWPEYFPLDDIEKIRRGTLASVFSTEYMLEPISGESSMLPQHLMLAGEQRRPELVCGAFPSAYGHLGLRYVMGVDLAFSQANDADFTAACVLGVDDGGNRYVVELFRARGVSYTAQFNLICDLHRKWRCERILVEANQAQRILPAELARRTDLPVRPFTTTQNKHDIHAGLPGLKLLAENHKWRLPMGQGPQLEMVGRLLAELESFTLLGGRVVSVGDHDDLGVACWLANEALKQADFRFQPQPDAGMTRAAGPLGMGQETRRLARYQAGFRPGTTSRW